MIFARRSGMEQQVYLPMAITSATLFSSRTIGLGEAVHLPKCASAHILILYQPLYGERVDGRTVRLYHFCGRSLLTHRGPRAQHPLHLVGEVAHRSYLLMLGQILVRALSRCWQGLM